jgi:Rha family phage regulatory protein
MKSNVVYVKQNRVLTDSRHLAEVFGKQHFHVLRTIEEQLKEMPEEFSASNFGLVDFLDAKGEKRPMYELTYDAFTLIAMGFTGKKASAYKIEYIQEFNRMRDELDKRGLETYTDLELLMRALTRLEVEKARANKAEETIITNQENASQFAQENLKPMSLWMKEFPILQKKGIDLLKQCKPFSKMTEAGCLTLLVKKAFEVVPLQKRVKNGNLTACQYDRATILKLITLIEEETK